MANPSREPCLLIQVAYKVSEQLFLKLLEICRTQELIVAHVYQKEIGDLCVLSLEVYGVWHHLVKLEAQLEELSRALVDGQLYWQRVTDEVEDVLYLPYVVEAQTLVSNEIVSVITQFFSVKQIRIDEIYVDQWVQGKTLVPMQTIALKVYLPITLSLSELRENFMILCEQYNFDAIFEQDRR